MKQFVVTVDFTVSAESQIEAAEMVENAPDIGWPDNYAGSGIPRARWEVTAVEELNTEK